MAEEEGRPPFDLSSFSNYSFPPVDQDGPPPEVARGSRPSSIREDDVEVDLVKYGPPGALGALMPALPLMVRVVIHESLENVRARVAAETKLLQRQQEEERRQNDGQSSNPTGKGKGVEGDPAVPDNTQASSAASDHTDESFHTPSEGRTTASDALSDSGTEMASLSAVTKQVAEETTADPKPRASSTSALGPRRRDLLKAVLRKVSDTATRRRLLRRSTGALRLPEVQLRAKVRNAKQLLHHHDKIKTGSVQPVFFNFFPLRPVF